MIRLTNLADYAVVLTREIAVRRDRQCAQGLSDVTDIPVATVAKILNILARKHILTSHRGAGGGFMLARDAGAISVADIIEAIDGPIALTNCSNPTTQPCSYRANCCMRNHWSLISAAVRQSLDQITLARLITCGDGPLLDFEMMIKDDPANGRQEA